MSPELLKFTKQLKAFSEATKEALDATLREIVIDIGTRLITISPVLTGRFKGNWQMTVGTPSDHSLNTFDPEGNETIAALKQHAGTFSAGEVAYIVNNLTYGYNIEVGGWPSGKPPYAIVRTTETQFTAIVEAAIAKHRVK